jgi:hypothetical protein
MQVQESQKQYQKLGLERNPNFEILKVWREDSALPLSFATARLIPTNLSMPFDPVFFFFS